MENFTADAIFIDAPPSRVFAALLDPEEVLIWLDGETARVEPRIGGEFTAERADGSVIAGTISALDPDELLEISEYYHEAMGERRGPMALRFTLQPRDGGVWLTVRQEGLDTGGEWHSFAKGTRKELLAITLALKRHIEQI
jgi:uncharacterized protein YndB with AHSA1/START domain